MLALFVAGCIAPITPHVDKSLLRIPHSYHLGAETRPGEAFSKRMLVIFHYCCSSSEHPVDVPPLPTSGLHSIVQPRLFHARSHYYSDASISPYLVTRTINSSRSLAHPHHQHLVDELLEPTCLLLQPARVQRLPLPMAQIQLMIRRPRFPPLITPTTPSQLTATVTISTPS